MKVVDSGYKIDLHIHSVQSYGKDGDKVAFNTLEHIDILAKKLNENSVQICAITDHDVFGYDMYRSLKKAETDDASSIVKVFPGVEFSVEFTGDKGPTVLHVIAIFNDEDDDKVKAIANTLTDDNVKPKYDRNSAFSEEKFLSILRDINLDTVLIVHQKSTLSSSRPYKNDARSVGEEKFYEFVYTDYFEAFEFKNRKNEVFNKNFMAMNNLPGEMSFVTGSDCHDWRYYPKTDDSDTVDFKHSYVKCIPNFRGLVMAMTDHRRIKTVNSFFNPTEVYVPEVKVTINGSECSIPLSRGINVIIGDNSIGKSLLLHKLTDFRKTEGGSLSKQIVTGYKTYIKNEKFDVLTEIPAADVFAFDMQGEIRSKFEQGKLKSDDFLKQYYPDAINVSSYLEKVRRELNRIYKYLEEKFAIELAEAQLSSFQIIDADSSQAESLTFVGSVSKNNKLVNELGELNGEIDTIVEKLETLGENNLLEQADRDTIDRIIEMLGGISLKYGNKKKTAERENEKIALFQAAVNSFKQKYQSTVSDTQKKLSTYNENLTAAAETISSLIIRRRANRKPLNNLNAEVVDVQTLRVYDYSFNSRLGISEISPEYIDELFVGNFKKNSKPVLSMNQDELAGAILRYNGTPADALQEIKDRIETQLATDFANKFTITQAGTDKTQELSAGFNSKIYFDILSYETSHRGIYIIDQPEDNVSQKSIREYLLDRFKVMGENRQVIIVTHNPQFIVNLDVDNVIYIGKNDKDELYVQSGALEYKNEEYSILDIISNHIEGGLETLRRRWKRYEKGSALQNNG